MFFNPFKTTKLRRYSPRERRLIRNFKAAVCLFLVFILIVGGVFSYIWPRMKIVTLIYEYNYLQVREKKLVHYNKMLRLELASIMSLDKVEKVAIGKMGMIVPEDKNVIFAKVEN